MIAYRYRLRELLGIGGFGRVWRARDEVLGVDIALKEVWLPELMSDAEAAERRVRAEREAHHAAQLRDHPNIVAVHDLVFEDGVPWTVMRLVTGMPLDQRLRNGPLSTNATVGVARALLSALEAVHAVGIVHRDVKPANILLAAGGQILLTDFGIAAHEADTPMTATGTVIGSAEYMAPERIDGLNDGPAGDMFSLGVTLYEAVVGTSPFRRDTRNATLNAICVHSPPPPEPPGLLAALIMALLDKHPDRRPTATEALRMLNAAPVPKARVITVSAPEAGLRPACDTRIQTKPLSSKTATETTLPRALVGARDTNLPAGAAPVSGGGAARPLLAGDAERVDVPNRISWRLLIFVLVLTVLAVTGIRMHLAHRYAPIAACAATKGENISSVAKVPEGKLPSGTPHPPSLVTPADQATFVVGQPIKLVWDSSGAVSGVGIASNDNEWKYSGWKSHSSCLFTPATPGLYRWSVFAKSVHAETPSAESEERTLLVRPKSGASDRPPRGVPPPPSPIAPSDQTKVRTGHEITLTWRAAGKYSLVAMWGPGGKWRYLEWQKTASYTFRPPSPGVYIWQVFTANEPDGERDYASGGSAQRYLVVQ
ncbi:serine/threonine-protein kinase [Streptomyces sp. NPDC058989]|uniref:serine/threonine-protein kinase n=1 Tax=Streptomyces sp. NPDC058989 TaxID=3346686 RepID=UPI0036C91A4F